MVDCNDLLGNNFISQPHNAPADGAMVAQRNPSEQCLGLTEYYSWLQDSSELNSSTRGNHFGGIQQAKLQLEAAERKRAETGALSILKRPVW